MPKKFIKRWLPDHKKLRKHKRLQIFGKLVHDPNLWHLNRYSVATAFSVGLFVAFVPVPFQMVLAAALAIVFHANLPISVALVWLTNPITMPPMFYFAYRLGAWILGRSPQGFKFELTWDWLMDSMKTIGPSFLLGCFVCGLILALIGNVFIRLLWRYTVSRSWRKRKLRRKHKLLSMPKLKKKK